MGGQKTCLVISRGHFFFLLRQKLAKRYLPIKISRILQKNYWIMILMIIHFFLRCSRARWQTPVVGRQGVLSLSLCLFLFSIYPECIYFFPSSYICLLHLTSLHKHVRMIIFILIFLSLIPAIKTNIYIYNQTTHITVGPISTLVKAGFMKTKSPKPKFVTSSLVRRWPNTKARNSSNSEVKKWVKTVVMCCSIGYMLRETFSLELRTNWRAVRTLSASLAGRVDGFC